MTISSDSDDDEVVLVQPQPRVKREAMTPPPRPSSSKPNTPQSARPTPKKAAETRRLSQSNGSFVSTTSSNPETTVTMPREALSGPFNKIPREVAAGKTIKRMPRRAVGGTSASLPRSGPGQATIDAELKFASIKLELLRIFVEEARRAGEEPLQAWKKVVEDGTVARALAVGRSTLKDEKTGRLPEDIAKLDALEHAFLQVLF